MKNKKCSIWWCDNPYYAVGYCKAHYQANLRHGSPYGMHPETMEKIEVLTSLSRALAMNVTEYVARKTEFAQLKTEFERKSHGFVDAQLDIETNTCPFCGSNLISDEHVGGCVVNLSREVLDETTVYDGGFDEYSKK